MPAAIDPDAMRVLGLTMKAELRKSMLLKRTMTPKEQRAAAAEKIAARLAELDEWKRARSIALFRSIASKGEVDTSSIDRAARAAKMRVAYPGLVGDDIADATMVFRWVDDLATLRWRGRGFAEALEGEVAEALDLVIVPGLAFDPAGYRVGYGAGLYDRTLPHYASAARVGIAFDFQLVMELPRNDHDVPVSVIVTDRKVLRG